MPDAYTTAIPTLFQRPPDFLAPWPSQALARSFVLVNRHADSISSIQYTVLQPVDQSVHLSRPEVQVRFYRLTGDLPARREAWADSTLADDREAQAFRIELTRAVPTPMIPEWEEVTTKIMDQTEAAVRGGITAAQALAALDRDVNRLLERRRFLLARRGGNGGP